MRKTPTKAQIAAHLADARQTSFLAIERPEDWSRIEARYAAEDIARRLDAFTLGKLIALTIQKEDRARAEEITHPILAMPNLSRERIGFHPMRHNVVSNIAGTLFDPRRYRRP
jgi:hypothetical protein